MSALNWIVKALTLGHRLRMAYWRIAAPTVLGVRALIVNEGQVMLVRHTYLPGWYLPGGKVERGETAYQALCREVREECSLEVVRARLLAIYSNRDSNPNDHVALFLVEEFRSLDYKGWHRYEIAEYGFFDLNRLPKEASKSTLRRLEEYSRGTFGDYW